MPIVGSEVGDSSTDSVRRGGTQEAQQARAEETRAALLSKARQMFAQFGFYKTGTVALVTSAHVTSGALYHHFRDKKTLFEAVFLEVLNDLRRSAEAEARRARPTRWELITGAFDNYLRLVASSPEFQRIVLIDGPVVFGWSHWRELFARHVTTDIETTVSLLMEDGLIAQQPSWPLANLLQGALNEAALSIANSPEPHRVQAEVSQAFFSLLQGLHNRA
ncbi:TetR/AcrR family transcriptional regulator [Sphingobium tyrosinilyticum]|uniref:TetR/AcrR family transcriptional regulator n=1 Tax=Sphingobium tyrosinilyticum TaxID=2715436 RepID=A0ABV9F3Z1_9SPHN